MCSHAHTHACTFVHRRCPRMCTYGCMCSNVCADFHNACTGFHACTQHATVCICLNICVCTCRGLHTCLSGLCLQFSAAQKQQKHLELNISQTNPSLPQTCSAHSPSEHPTCFSGAHPLPPSVQLNQACGCFPQNIFQTCQPLPSPAPIPHIPTPHNLLHPPPLNTTSPYTPLPLHPTSSTLITS